MYAFRRMMIALDFTAMDQELIPYVARLCRLIDPERLCFIHVQPELDVVPELEREFPALLDSPVEQLRQEMQQRIEPYFLDFDSWRASSQFLVLEGSPRKELLRQTQEQDIDLLVVGRKEEQKGSGLVPAQVARKVRCSMLFVPAHPPKQLSHLLVGCDYSAHAKLALQEALRLKQRAAHPIKVALQHVYQVPMGYYKTGRTEAQFAALMRQHAEKRLIKFADEYNLDLSEVEKVFVYDRDKSSPAILLQQEAQAREVDLIVVAARGLSGLSALFLGSVTEKLINLESDIPVLVVKEKDKSYSLINLIEDI